MNTLERIKKMKAELFEMEHELLTDNAFQAAQLAWEAIERLEQLMEASTKRTRRGTEV